MLRSIIMRTEWTLSPAARLVWIALLALADEWGEADLNDRMLPHLTGLPWADVLLGLGELQAPGEYGPCIERIPQGWELLNYRYVAEPIWKEGWRKVNRDKARARAAAKRAIS